MAVAVTSTTASPKPTIATKIDRQPAATSRSPPTVGATAGPAARMMPIRFMIRAERSPWKRSRTSAREMAMPAEAPMPCTKRAAISMPTSCAISPARLARQ